jgi:hypothetical protein
MKIRVWHPNNKIDEFNIDSERVLVGSGAHCDIRIDGAGAGHEHVIVEQKGHEIVARGLYHAPPALYRGVPIIEMQLSNGSEIAVCGTRITFDISPKKERQGRSTGRRIAMAAAISLLLVIVPTFVYARLHRGNDSYGRAPAPAVLFDGEPETCKADGNQSLALARRARALGLARRERHPFFVEDGIAAVGAFRLSSACYAKGGEKTLAREAGDEGAALEKVIEHDYFMHRVRFEHALETEDVKSALFEVKMLRRMTAHRKGPYTEWLAMVERRLEAAVREAEERTSALSAAFGSGK